MFSSSLLGYLTGIIVKWSRLIGGKQQQKLTTYIPLEYTGETQELSDSEMTKPSPK